MNTMVTLAGKMFLWLIVAVLLGFAWAWLWRGIRDRNKFDYFFREWRLRYDNMERDYTAQLQEVERLKALVASNVSRETARANKAIDQIADSTDSTGRSEPTLG